MGSALEDAVSGVSDKIVAALLPKLEPIVANAALAAEPTIKTVMEETVIPQVGTWTVVGLGVAAAIGALVGTWVAKRGARK
jgi:hypothetical protein